MDKTIEVTIRGITPLLCNRFSDEAMMKASSGTSISSMAGDPGTAHEQAEKCLYFAEGTAAVIPGPNLFRSIIDAGKYFKNGKSKVTTQKSSMIPAVLALNELYMPIRSPHPWTVDSRAIRNPATGGRRVKHRPCFHQWELDFTLTLDTKEMAEALLREIVDAAGKKIGLGDFRPDCKGPFGRYVVIAWK